MRSPICSKLGRLDASNCGISSDGVRALAESPQLAALVELNLDDNKLGRRGIRALVQSECLPNLREVTLAGEHVHAKDVRCCANGSATDCVCYERRPTATPRPSDPRLVHHLNFARSSGLTRLVHLSACDGKVHGDLPPGRGVVDFPPYLREIKNLGIDGAVSIELEYSPEPAKIVEWVREAYDKTDALMQKAGLRG